MNTKNKNKYAPAADGRIKDNPDSGYETTTEKIDDFLTTELDNSVYGYSREKEDRDIHGSLNRPE